MSLAVFLLWFWHFPNVASNKRTQLRFVAFPKTKISLRRPITLKQQRADTQRVRSHYLLLEKLFVPKSLFLCQIEFYWTRMVSWLERSWFERKIICKETSKVTATIDHHANWKSWLIVILGVQKQNKTIVLWFYGFKLKVDPHGN